MFASDNYDAEILVVTDPVNPFNNREGWAMPLKHMEHFAKTATKNNFKKNTFAYVNCGPEVPEELTSSKTKTSKYLKQYIPDFLEICSRYKNLKLVVTMGAWAAHQFAAKQVKITQVRGQASIYNAFPVPVFHMYAMGYVLAHPGNQLQFEADFHRLAQLKHSSYSLESVALDSELDYRWCTDLEEWLDCPPAALAYDTEGTGLEWYKPSVYPFTLQLCRKAGSAIMVPIAKHYYPELPRNHNKLIKQARQLMSNPKIRKACHNTKYDYHMLKNGLDPIQVEGPYLDTQQMLFCVDENLFNKSLDEGVRLFVPDMAGYADEFNAAVDKARMIEVDKRELLVYGCGDADAVFRLAKVLSQEMKKDSKQYFLFENLQMPALIAFAESLEKYGVPVDENELRNLGQVLEQHEQNLYNQLIREVPAKVKRKHLEANKALSFSRSSFVVDTLFTRDGFKLVPKVFTDSTKKEKDPSKRIPATDAKKHLSYFTDFETKTGYKFVENLIEYQKLQKMRGTYVGYEYDEKKKGPSGFWQYLHEGIIRPSYFLSTTVTGRTSSRSPNGQNIPKRGKFAKAYRKLFKAPPGWKLIQADYSQAELRVAACMANEPTMIQAYKDGQDIHAITGALLSRITLDELLALPEEEMDDKRYKAKAANFGLLYGVQAPSYKEYAYTQYGLSLTLKEAEEARELFFSLYNGLPEWHEDMKAFVHRYGYVRSLHGAKRNLPDINSSDKWIVAEAERQAINSPVQRFGSDLGVMALMRIVRDIKACFIAPPIEPRMFIHDANVFMVPDEYLEQALSYIKWYMESNPIEQWFDLNLQVPIIADLEVGQNLGELQKRKDVIAIRPSWANCDIAI